MEKLEDVGRQRSVRESWNIGSKPVTEKRGDKGKENKNEKLACRYVYSL